MKEISAEFQNKLLSNLELLSEGKLDEMTIPLARLRKINRFKTKKAMNKLRKKIMDEE